MENKRSPIWENNFFIFIFCGGILAFLFLLSALFQFPSLLAVAGTFLALSLLLFFQKPLKLLFALIFVRMFLDYSSNYIYLPISKNFSLSLSQFIGLAVAALGILVLVYYRKKLSGFQLWLPFLIILAWSAVTLLFSISFSSSLQEIIRIFGLLSLALLAYLSLEKRDDFKKLFLVIFASALIPLILGVYQLIFRIGFQDETVSIPRIFGSFSHPNVFSLFIFVIIILLFLFGRLFLKDNKPQEKIIYYLFFSFNLIVLYLTYTRIAWIALAVFFGIIAALRRRKLLIPLVLIPLLLFFLSSDFRQRIDETLDPPADSSITWRKQLWKDTVSRTIDGGNSLLGYGLNTFPIVSESTRGIALGSNDPHNDFVKFFVEGGFVGFGIFLIYLGLIIFILWKQKKSAPADSKLNFIFETLLIMFLALIISSLSDNIFKNTPVQWLFWIILGASLALAKKQKNRPETI